MRRPLITGLLIVLVGLMPSMAAQAFQVCWRLQDGATPPNPLLDFVRISVTQKDDTDPVIFELHASVEADPLYHMVGSGTATRDVEADFTKYRMGLTLTHTRPGFFGNNRVCAFTALLNTTGPDALNGTWSEQCAGGPAGPFNVSGNIIYMPGCAGASTASLNTMQQRVMADHERQFGQPLAAGNMPSE